MELRTLRYFIYVAEARSFSKASVHLRIAQPALSRQIRKLEDEVGVPLILRTGRQLELTEAGALLLTRAHMLLRQTSQTIEDVRTFASNLGGLVTIGVSPATCEVLAPLIVRNCAVAYPNIRISFVEGFSGLIFNQLLNQELTLCVLHNPPQHRAIKIEPLLVEAMYLVGPAEGTSDLPPASTEMALETLPLVLPNQTHGLRLLIDQALGKRRTQINVAVPTDGFVTTMALVSAGLGYTILPYSSIHQQLKAGQLSAARRRDLDLPWTLSLAYWSDHRSARRVQALSEIIRAQVERLAFSGEWGNTIEGQSVQAVARDA
jgi:LysR family nitrogen assimilation transcriptional regulator